MTWNTEPFIAFDLETTGPDPVTARIVTAAVVKFENGEPIETCRPWLVNPGVPIPPEAAAVHGVTDEIAASGSTAASASIEILNLLAPGFRVGHEVAQPVVVAFNAAYDFTVLARELDRYHPGVSFWLDRIPVIDPRVIDKQKDRYRKGKRTLSDVCAHYGVDHPDAHNAVGDAMAAGNLTLALAEKYPELTKVDTAYLHERQAAWYADQAKGLAQYWRDTAVRIVAVDGDGPEPQELMQRARTINTHWPIIPVERLP